MILPLALTRRGLGLALASIGLGAGWLLIGLRDVWYLVALLAALVVVALLTLALWSVRARPELRLSAGDPTPTVGASVSLTVTVRHRLPTTVQAEISLRAAGEPLSTRFTAKAGEQTAVSVDWHPGGRGPAEVRIAALKLGDPLGLALLRIRPGKSVSLLVLPRPLEALTALLEAGGRHGTDGDRTRPGFGHRSGAPAGALRQYRAGDPLREVHWKQSARQGELLVNLHEQTDQHERSLLLDADPRAYRSAAEFELAVSATAALAEHWLRSGHPVRMHLGDETPVPCAKEDEMLRVLALTVTAPPPAEASLGARDALPSVIVTGTVTERLAGLMRQASPGGGTVYALHESPLGQAPEAWRQITVPGPDPDRPESPVGDRPG